MFLELYNTPKRYRRDIKSNRQTIISPRLSLCLAGHPQSFVDATHSEMSAKEDGLIQRFLVFSPMPSIDNDLDAIEASNPCCSLDILFLVIKRMHTEVLEYEMDDNAKEEFKLIFSTNNAYIKKFNNHDTFIR